MTAVQALQSMVSAVDNRVNPVLLKELRQAVRGRVVSGSLLFFVLTAGLMMVIALISAIDRGSGRLDAEDLIGPLFAILQFTALGIIPISVGMRLAAERSINNTDLMFVSTLSPTRIVIGKFLAGIVVALLIYSACLPFMTLSYLFRGMDIPTIVLNLIIGFHLVMIGIAAGILTAAVTTNRFLRVFLSLGFVGLLISLGFMSAVTYDELGWSGDAGMILQDMHILFTYVLSSFVSVWIALGLLLFSVAALEPPSANRVFRLRIYLLAMVLMFLVVIPLIIESLPSAGWGSSISNEDFFEVAFPMISLMIGLMIMIACNERDQYGQQLRRQIPHHPLFRLLAFPTYSGAAGGIIFSLLAALLAIIFLTVWSGITPMGRTSLEWQITFLLSIVSHALMYGLAGRLTQYLLQNRNATSDQSWVFSLAIAAALIVVPVLLVVLIGGRVDNLFEGPLAVFNPFISFEALSYRPDFPQFPLLIILGVGSLLAALPWIVAQIQRFTPLRKYSRHLLEGEQIPGL